MGVVFRLKRDKRLNAGIDDLIDAGVQVHSRCS